LSQNSNTLQDTTEEKIMFLLTPNAISGLLIVVLSILLSIAGMYIVRRRVPFARLKANNEVAGFIYSMIGIVYAVLLGFLVVVVWERYSDTESSVHEEAVHISILLRDAETLPEAPRRQLQEHLLTYAKSVIEQEWQTMAKGQQSPATTEAYNNIWKVYYDLQPQSEREKIFYQEAIDGLGELSHSRRFRLLSSRSGLPVTLWVLLIGGGCIAVGFTYLFGIESARTQTLMVASLAGLIGFTLFLIISLDYPFSGDLRIEPEAIKSVIEMWEPMVKNKL
jgi:hypothetical protein